VRGTISSTRRLRRVSGTDGSVLLSSSLPLKNQHSSATA